MKISSSIMPMYSSVRNDRHSPPARMSSSNENSHSTTHQRSGDESRSWRRIWQPVGLSRWHEPSQNTNWSPHFTSTIRSKNIVNFSRHSTLLTTSPTHSVSEMWTSVSSERCRRRDWWRNSPLSVSTSRMAISRDSSKWSSSYDRNSLSTSSSQGMS